MFVIINLATKHYKMLQRQQKPPQIQFKAPPYKNKHSFYFIFTIYKNKNKNVEKKHNNRQHHIVVFMLLQCFIVVVIAVVVIIVCIILRASFMTF